MKLVIFTIGTQGDARPFVGLGRGLAARGHEVVIATAQNYQPMITGAGLAHALIPSDFMDLMARERDTITRGNQLEVGRKMAQALIEWAPQWARLGLEAAQDADIIIGSGSGTVLAASVAEKLNRPFVQVQFMPLSVSATLPPLWPAPRRQWPPTLNLLLSKAVRLLGWRVMAKPSQAIRDALGLPPYPWSGPWAPTLPNGQPRYTLYAFSPAILPQPADWPTSHALVCGNWFLDEGAHWQAPEALERFLATDPRPVYVGFGSMRAGDTEAFTATVMDGIRRSGQRAIVATGWGGLQAAAASDERLFFIDGAPHDWLFPRVAAAVHHGGAGTMAAAARAGVPQVVVPFMADQPFWSWHLHRIGLSPAMLERKTLSAEALAVAIQAALGPEFQQRAAQMQVQMRGEDGIGRTIAALEGWGLLKA